MSEPTQPSDESVSERAERNRSDMKSPGEMLREARLAQDWSVEDLCAETKLSEKSIHALENNQFNELSQPIFAGGYYRQCAKLLGIDSERMMAAYAAWGGKKTSSQTAAAAPTAMDVVPQDVTSSHWRALAAISALVLVVIIGAVVLFMPESDTQTENRSADSDAASSGDDTVAFTDGQPAQGDSARIGSGNSSATGGGQPAARSSRDSGTSVRVSPGTDATSGANTGRRSGGRNVNDTLGIDREAERRRREQQRAPPEPQVEPNHLVVNFTDRSWVDIRDANGARLLNGIYEAGETREFDADAPYRITLGYAPGVDMTIGGEDVDIDTQTTSNSTARLTVDARDS